MAGEPGPHEIRRLAVAVSNLVDQEGFHLTADEWNLRRTMAVPDPLDATFAEDIQAKDAVIVDAIGHEVRRRTRFDEVVARAEMIALYVGYGARHERPEHSWNLTTWGEPKFATDFECRSFTRSVETQHLTIDVECGPKCSVERWIEKDVPKAGCGDVEDVFDGVFHTRHRVV